jgi:mRNA interferase MazF
MLEKGGVWLVDLPDSDGHEQAGLRPAIVLADCETPLVVIVPCTTNLQTLHFPYTLPVLPNLTNKLFQPSVAMIFQMRATDKKRVRKRIGNLGWHDLKKIDQVLRSFFRI